MLKPSMAPFWKSASGQRLLDHSAEAMNANHVHQGCYFILSCCIFSESCGLLPETLHVMFFAAMTSLYHLHAPLACTNCIPQLINTSTMHI